MSVLDMLLDKTGAGQREHFEAWWRANLAENFKAGRLNFNRGRGRFRDGADLLFEVKPKATTVIAAGPSAGESLPFVSPETLTLCADRELLEADAYGIRPSFVFSVDPRPEISEFYRGIKTERLRLIAPAWISPEALAAWKGVVYFYTHRPRLSGMTDTLRYAAGARAWLAEFGNVGSAMVSAAISWFRAPIVFLCGLDFSWKQNLYSDGALDILKSKTPKPAIDVYGAKCVTSPEFMEFARNVNNMIAGESGMKFYNCSSGIIINGIIQNLADACASENIKPGRNERGNLHERKAIA